MNPGSIAPITIEIALYYHSRVDDWRGGDFSAPICSDIFDWFVKSGLLFDNAGSPDPSRNKRRYNPTPLLHGWVEMLCDTPLPVPKLVDPRTGTVIEFK